MGPRPLTRRKARKARDPKAGDEVFVPEKLVVTVKPGQIMQQRVKGTKQTPMTVGAGTSPNR